MQKRWRDAAPRSNSLRLTIVLLLSCSLVQGDDLQQADQALVAAYQDALTSEKGSEVLKETELAWLTYRDAEANLEGCIAGKTTLDKAAHDASFLRTTRARTQELEAIALTPKQNGNPSPFSGDIYGAIRRAVIATKNVPLIAALINDQKAWDSYSELNISFSAQTVMNQAREEQLETWARELNISITNPPHNDQVDWNTTLSEDGMLRIDTGSKGILREDGYVTSNATGEEFNLPKLKEMNADYGSQYYISPDNQWIFRQQKLFHGADHVYLYERVGMMGVQYYPVLDRAIDDLAWECFLKTTGMTVPPHSVFGGLTNFVAWKPGKVRLSLNTSARLTFANVGDWEVDYDIASKTCSVPEELTSHDEKAFKK